MWSFFNYIFGGNLRYYLQKQIRTLKIEKNMTTKFYKYAHCGNVIQKVVDSKVLVFCCGQNLDGENLVDCFCKAEDGSMTLLPSK